jgi:hypothetical protein
VETISDRFRAAIADGHTTTVRTLVLPDGDETSRVDISDYFADGSVDISRQAIRRSGSVTFTDVDASGLIVPTSPDSLLAPYGNQLRIYAGIDYGDGTEETVCVGTFRITRSTSSYPQCTVDLSDRAWIVSNAKLIAPYHVASGTPWDVAVTSLLMDRYPGVPTDIPGVEFDTTTPRITLDEQADPWEQMQKWVASFGYALYFSPLGVATIAGELQLANADPVWAFDGTDAAIPTDLTDDNWSNMSTYDEANTWDSADAYNAVVISGNSSSNSATVQGVAYDTDPHSPTQWGGSFGRKPLFENNELATTNLQATRLAVGRLQQVAGLAESLTIPSVTNPAFEVGDQVNVIRPDLGINTIHTLDRIPLPLRGGGQVLQTRVRRVVVSGDS